MGGAPFEDFVNYDFDWADPFENQEVWSQVLSTT